MKKQFILLLTLLISSAVMAQSQRSDYETWRQKKEQEYTKWQKLRGEVAGLPTSPEQEAISGFISEGFGEAQAASPQPAPPSAAPSQQPLSPNMRIWVVVVGVADYVGVGKLNYTDDDAYRMYAFYKSAEGGSLPDNQISVLIDEDATRKNVMQAMNDVYAKAGRNDAIIFYFSGHGAQDAFVTREYDGATTNNRGLLLHDEIHRIFERSEARYKYIIADACHSGSWARRDMQRTAPTGAAYYQSFENATGGFVLLLSSMGDEYSLERSGIRQGIFSHYLIRGLKGEADTNRDNVVSVVELFDYVKANVTTSTDHKQNPVLSGNYQGNPPISILGPRR